MHPAPTSLNGSTELPARNPQERVIQPWRHAARDSEARTAAELAQLDIAHEFVAAYEMDGTDLGNLLMIVRSLYRRPSSGLSLSAWRFLDDLARAIDDAEIDEYIAGGRSNG